MANWGIVLWLIGLTVITFFAIAWCLDINNRQRQSQQRLDQMFAGAEEIDMAAPLQALTAQLEATNAQTTELQNELYRLIGSLPNSIQAVGLVRFQAFSDYGGDQSFSLALANASGNGVVMSGIFAREGTRVYAKPLQEWKSTYSLSFEEEEAISTAHNQLQDE